MSLKSRSTIYDRLEKLVYNFAAAQDDDETGLNGKESVEFMAQRFSHWLGHNAHEGEPDGKPRIGKVFMKEC